MALFDLKLCDVQRRLFSLSVTNGYGNENFIKTFMNSETAKKVASNYNCIQCFREEHLFDEVLR